MAVSPGRTGSSPAADTARHTPAAPAKVVPPAPLPAPSLQLAEDASALLGWQGVVLPQMTLLGRKVHVVARLRTDAHAERIATGVGPVTDRAAVSTWLWPELAATAPSPAVEIRGVLAVTRHWRTALAWVAPFARYYDAGMVLPLSIAMSRDYLNDCLPRARAYGLAALTVDDAANVQPDLTPCPENAMLADDAISRWVNELVYEQLGAAVGPETSAQS